MLDRTYRSHGYKVDYGPYNVKGLHWLLHLYYIIRYYSTLYAVCSNAILLINGIDYAIEAQCSVVQQDLL